MTPGLTKQQLFEKAEFWDGRSSDCLRHTSYIEALEEVVDDEYRTGENILECIERISPVILTAHVQNEFSENQQDSYAKWVLEQLLETVEEDEEVGSGEDCLNLSVEAEAACLLKAKELVAELAKYHKPYWCREIGSIELSAQEVEAELREFIPHWFVGFPAGSEVREQ